MAACKASEIGLWPYVAQGVVCTASLRIARLRGASSYSTPSLAGRHLQMRSGDLGLRASADGPLGHCSLCNSGLPADVLHCVTCECTAVYDAEQRSAQRATLTLQLQAVLAAITPAKAEPEPGDDTVDGWRAALRTLPAAAVAPAAVNVGGEDHGEVFSFALAYAAQCVDEKCYTVPKGSVESKHFAPLLDLALRAAANLTEDLASKATLLQVAADAPYGFGSVQIKYTGSCAARSIPLPAAPCGISCRTGPGRNCERAAQVAPPAGST